MIENLKGPFMLSNAQLLLIGRPLKSWQSDQRPATAKCRRKAEGSTYRQKRDDEIPGWQLAKQHQPGCSLLSVAVVGFSNVLWKKHILGTISS